MKEKAGTHIIVYRDESYVYEMHNGDFSLLFRDDDGNLIPNIPMAVRNGRRVCFAGCITKFGHYTGYYQDDTGEWVPYRDSAWLDGKGKEVMKGDNSTN